jgi:hypothetical protein
LQSSTLIIRGMATGVVELSDVRTVFFREVKVGLLMGLACGVMLTLVGWVWHQAFLGMVVGVSLVIAFLVSTSLATIMPVVLKRMGVDPAVARRSLCDDGQRYYGHHHLSLVGHAVFRPSAVSRIAVDETAVVPCEKGLGDASRKASAIILKSRRWGEADGL